MQRGSEELGQRLPDRCGSGRLNALKALGYMDSRKYPRLFQSIDNSKESDTLGESRGLHDGLVHGFCFLVVGGVRVKFDSVNDDPSKRRKEDEMAA